MRPPRKTRPSPTTDLNTRSTNSTTRRRKGRRHFNKPTRLGRALLRGRLNRMTKRQSSHAKCSRLYNRQTNTRGVRAILRRLNRLAKRIIRKLPNPINLHYHSSKFIRPSTNRNKSTLRRNTRRVGAYGTRRPLSHTNRQARHANRRKSLKAINKSLGMFILTIFRLRTIMSGNHRNTKRRNVMRYLRHRYRTSNGRI